MSLTKIIIADDHTLFADGLEQIVHSMKGFEVIGKVTDGKLLLQKLNTTVPDMILLDINMPHLDGIATCMKIAALRPEIKIVFISMFYNAQILEQVKQIGATGFIMKDVTAPALKEALITIRDGSPVFLLPEDKHRSDYNFAIKDQLLVKYKLTPREQEIIRLIKEGNATKQIASILELSIYTVETHRKNINRKLNVQNTAELIAVINQI
ncbi:MAG TPA: response regulator transcription factor [Niastella sp.]